MTIKLDAPWVQGLKEKRMLVKSLQGKLINKFQISVIASDAQDVHKTIIISLAFPSHKDVLSNHEKKLGLGSRHIIDIVL